VAGSAWRPRDWDQMERPERLVRGTGMALAGAVVALLVFDLVTDRGMADASAIWWVVVLSFALQAAGVVMSRARKSTAAWTAELASSLFVMAVFAFIALSHAGAL
jgi:hypothetical protein